MPNSKSLIAIFCAFLCAHFCFSQSAPPGYRGHRVLVGLEYNLQLGTGARPMKEIEEAFEDRDYRLEEGYFEAASKVTGALTILIQYVLDRHNSLLFETTLGRAWVVAEYSGNDQSLAEISGVQNSAWMNYGDVRPFSDLQRFTDQINYFTFGLGYRKTWGIAPIGSYFDFSLAHSRYTLESTLEPVDMQANFIRVGAGVTNVLVGNITYHFGARLGVIIPVLSEDFDSLENIYDEDTFDQGFSKLVKNRVRAHNLFDLLSYLGQLHHKTIEIVGNGNLTPKTAVVFHEECLIEHVFLVITGFRQIVI